jgi:hypothetical protein
MGSREEMKINSDEADEWDEEKIAGWSRGWQAGSNYNGRTAPGLVRLIFNTGRTA